MNFEKRTAHPELKAWSDAGLALLDIECVKERSNDGVHPFRFRTYMIGLAYIDHGVVYTVQLYGNEEQTLLDDFVTFCHAHHFSQLGFSATRDFDINVLAGRWTSARKALAAPRTTYPLLDWSQLNLVTVNLRKAWKDLPRVDRTGDMNGFDCMREWLRGDPADKCVQHNLLDLIEMATFAEQTRV